MTNGHAIRILQDNELAATIYLPCACCIYDKAVDDSDPWYCVKVGNDCRAGKVAWLRTERGEVNDDTKTILNAI